jgi:methyl-accepting chemotaxis protein
MKRFIKMMQRLKSSIVSKLILYIFLISLVITFVGTSLELYLDYNSEIKSIHSIFKQVKSSYKKSLINSLWVKDYELLHIQMEGILQLPDIEFIEIRKGTKVLQTTGIPQSKSIIEHTIPLVYVYNNKDVHLGNMHIVASLKGAYKRTFDRFLMIFIIQMINIFLVSLFIFIFFYQLVGKHIISTASFIESISFDSTNQIFQLDRKLNTKNPDELDQLVTSFNLMCKNMTHDINQREIAEKNLKESEKKYRNLYERRMR